MSESSDVVYRGTSIVQIDTLHWVLGSGLIRDFTVAVDGGANIGEWSEVMARHFKTVHAFEPGGMFRAKAANIVFHPCALLDRAGRATLNRKGDNRGWWIRASARGDIQTVTVDSLGLSSCGLIKLDLEGADGLALLGALETIKRCSPVVVVELGRRHRKSPAGPSARKLMRGLGYGMVRVFEQDSIFVREDGIQ